MYKLLPLCGLMDQGLPVSSLRSQADWCIAWVYHFTHIRSIIIHIPLCYVTICLLLMHSSSSFILKTHLVSPCYISHANEMITFSVEAVLIGKDADRLRCFCGLFCFCMLHRALNLLPLTPIVKSGLHNIVV